MVKAIADFLRKAEAWPSEDQEELAADARKIEARRTGVYTLSDDGRACIREGLDEVGRGAFVADAVVAEADKRHGL